MRKVLRIIGAVLGFIALAIVTLNIEAVATSLGLNNVAANPTVVGAIAGVLTAPLTLYIALVCLGFGLFLVLDRSARVWDANHPNRDERLRAMWADMDELSEAIANQLQAGQPVPSVALAARVAAKYTTLNQLGMVTPLLPPLGRYWFSTNKLFLDNIAPVLREGHLRDAKGLAQQFVNTLNNTPPEVRAQVQQQLDQQFGGGA